MNEKTIKQRLAAIKAECERRGWEFSDHYISDAERDVRIAKHGEPGRGYIFDCTMDLDTAEAFLAATDPDAPVVEIGNYHSKAGDDRAAMVWHCNNNETKVSGMLAECVPPPGKYKLVKVSE